MEKGSGSRVKKDGDIRGPPVRWDLHGVSVKDSILEQQRRTNRTVEGNRSSGAVSSIVDEDTTVELYLYRPTLAAQSWTNSPSVSTPLDGVKLHFCVCERARLPAEQATCNGDAFQVSETESARNRESITILHPPIPLAIVGLKLPLRVNSDLATRALPS